MLAIAVAHVGLGLLVIQGSPVTVAAKPATLMVSLVDPPQSTAPVVVSRPIAMHIDLPRVPRPEVEIPGEAPPAAVMALNVSAGPAAPANAPATPTPDVAPPGDQPTTISDVAYVKQPAPRYPPVSRHAREEGLVILRVTIDETGRVRSAVVYRSSGHPRLDEAARDAVALALFKPYVSGGVARAAIAMIPIEFSLRGAAS